MSDPTIAVSIPDDATLEDLLSRPGAAAVSAMERLEGDLVVLGAGGKMGPTLARMARRAADKAGRPRRIIAVSRFSDPTVARALESHGVETLTGDLLDAEFVASLPPAPNVIFMAGQKFGTDGRESLTWALNTLAPALVCERYRESRIAVFSTGNVYPLVPVSGGGAVEGDRPCPVGEYAMSCLGRERVCEHFSRTAGTPIVILRLNYACELRYGVLVDIALRVRDGEPIDLTMGYVNVLWQGDANATAIGALPDAASPPLVLNIAGPEILAVRDVARELGRHLGRRPRFTGRESADALLSEGAAAHARYGLPRVDARQLIAWVADWVRRGGTTLAKPTHFEVRDGTF